MKKLKGLFTLIIILAIVLSCVSFNTITEEETFDGMVPLKYTYEEITDYLTEFAKGYGIYNKPYMTVIPNYPGYQYPMFQVEFDQDNFLIFFLDSNFNVYDVKAIAYIHNESFTNVYINALVTLLIPEYTENIDSFYEDFKESAPYFYNKNCIIRVNGYDMKREQHYIAFGFSKDK